MKRYLIYIVAVAVAVVMTACMAKDAALDVGDNQEPKPLPGRPTIPIKHRPMVHKDKLPRPRIIERAAPLDATRVVIELADEVLSAEVVVRNTYTDEEVGYIFEGRRVEVLIPDDECELTINVGDESYTYFIE